MENIYSLTLDDVTLTDVDSELESISEKAGVKIYRLYVTPEISEARKHIRAHRPPPAGLRLGSSRAESWELAVHVYAIDGEKLMDLDQLNE